MTNTKLCPTCHSKISLDENIATTNLKRNRGGEGNDSDGNPVPFWSHDPILTPDDLQLNGTDYKGWQRPSATDIKELQDVRKQQEIDLGVSPPTQFSEVQENFAFRASYLTELRISTERILDASGVTLQDYFKTDIDGNEQPAGPFDTPNKTDWTDVVRGNPIIIVALGNEQILLNNNTQFKLNNTDIKDVPGFPEIQATRGIYFEDLRHPVPLIQFVEYFSPSTIVTFPVTETTLPSGPLNVSSSSVITHNAFLLGDVFSSYKCIEQVNSQRWFIINGSTGDTDSGEFHSTVQTEISQSLLNNSNSRQSIITQINEYHSHISGIVGGATHYNIVRFQNNVAQSITIPIVFLKSPIKIKNNSLVQLFFEYDFNTFGIIPRGTIIGTEHPFKYTITINIYACRSTNLNIIDGTKTISLVVSKPLQGGSFVQSLPTISKVYTVNSEAEMLALNANIGDSAIRNDITKTFTLIATNATLLANWREESASAIITPHLNVAINDIVSNINKQTNKYVLKLDITSILGTNSSGSTAGISTTDPATIPDNIPVTSAILKWRGFKVKS